MSQFATMKPSLVMPSEQRIYSAERLTLPSPRKIRSLRLCWIEYGDPLPRNECSLPVVSAQVEAMKALPLTMTFQHFLHTKNLARVLQMPFGTIECPSFTAMVSMPTSWKPPSTTARSQASTTKAINTTTRIHLRVTEITTDQIGSDAHAVRQISPD